MDVRKGMYRIYLISGNAMCPYRVIYKYINVKHYTKAAAMVVVLSSAF